jgi:hypothetical protein
MATVDDVITRASDLLFDQSHVRWPEDELIRWINDAVREIIGYRPDLAAVTKPVSLPASGSSVQHDLSGDTHKCIRIIRVIRNIGGTGDAIRITDMANLTAYNPGWASADASSTVKNYMFDEETPTVFWTYPPVSNATVEVSFLQMPEVLDSGGDKIPLPDTFFNPVLDYVMFRAMSKDAEAGNLSARAAGHLQAFKAYFGDKATIDMAISPNMTNEGGAVPRQLRSG